ncbi:MAG TPA: LytTR family DNA-binding domain-containing protein [Allosphingosinicella sp.]
MGRRIAVELVVIAAIGVCLALLGPFGSYVLPLAPRLLFWVGTTLAGYAIFRPLMVVGAWLSKAAPISEMAANLVVLTIGAIPLTLLVLNGLTRFGEGSAAPGADFALVYAQVWGIGLAIALFMTRFLAPGQAGRPELQESPPVQSAIVRPRLVDRLAPSFGDRVLCLQMEDHYVRVHGENGSVLVLMRLADAIAELEGVEGMQVHRSWWVALDAVAGTLRRGQRLALVLSNAAEVPVSRSHAAAVRNARFPRSAAGAKQALS